MRIGRTGKLLAMLSVAVLAVSTAGVATSAAASAAPAGVSAKQAGQAQSDELSSRKRHGYVRHYRGGNGAARTFGAIAGTIGGIVAADQARRAYRHYYSPYYGYGYSPYAYQPYGYYDGYSYY